ncbi:L-ascorbate metabolism protein UlaG (beta-lactamase superfamily) [Sphingomonas jejuensis]|uniref:L-ascorbate metabolism protein UlaG (Beta-lactamase superfamily) n=1 Tax=Sphingomonas jejuensis TaxID=904715 RepID=A0ABX0XRD3_9SPHN|nr:MBL fold metallo-hydrolase [Sphingomonas jejuensis]NJC35210.1 L-ascorbate metabolism protein UlaG (beta-lactamase superfamily) [Sphingomonas jejuensis]
MVRRLLRWIGTGLLFLVVALCLSAVLVPPFLDRIYYRGRATGHFDGDRFFNPDGVDDAGPPGGGSRAGFLLSRLTGDDSRATWPDRVPVVRARPPERVTGDRMLATWVGHATVLVQTAGLNILTDPVWSDRAGPFGVGPRRVAVPGIRFEDLPPIDVVLVSHNHYDHLDLDTLKRLWARDRPRIVTSLGNDAVISKAGVPAVALDWNGRVPLPGGGEIVVTRNHHWGSRWFADRNRALWSSFVVRLPAGNIFFAGDTGPGDLRWPAEAAALGPVRLALIPVGAFRFAPGQMSTSSHIGPGDAALVFDRLRAGTGLPIHWGTFQLSDEGWDTPPRLLAEVIGCLRRDGIAVGRFGAVAIGRSVDIPAVPVQPAAAGRRPQVADVERCLATPVAQALR